MSEKFKFLFFRLTVESVSLVPAFPIHKVDHGFTNVTGNNIFISVLEHFFAQPRISTSNNQNIVTWHEYCFKNRLEFDPSLEPIEVVFDAIFKLERKLR